MDINFELYKIFYHAASSGSFSQAAEKLYISQSAVSQAIKNLEEKTGEKLFSRKTRSVRLTREGELLFRHIEQAYNIIKTGESKLLEMKNLDSGEVRIGAGDTICKYFLIPCMEKFIQLHPNIKIRVINRTSVQILEMLKQGMIDVGIVTLPVNEAGILTEEFLAVEDIFVASDRFSELRDREVSLDTLQKYPLLLLQKNTRTRKNLDDFLSSRGITLTPEIELENIDLLVEFARIGLGLAYVLKESAAGPISRGELFCLKTPENIGQRKLATAVIQDIPLSRASREFISFLKGRHG